MTAVLPYDRPGQAVSPDGRHDLRSALRAPWAAAVLIALAALPWAAAGAGDLAPADAGLADAPAFVPVPAPSPAPVTAAAWLDRLEGAPPAQEGRSLRMESPSQGRQEGVFHSPLSAVRFPTSDGSVAGSARFPREDTDTGGGFRPVSPSGDVSMHDGPQPVRAFAASTVRHPSAVPHDRLLSEPLACPTAGFPRGARFGTDGPVRASGGAPAGFRRSHGNFMAIEAGDGVVRLPDLAVQASRLGDRPSDTGEGSR